MTYEQCLQFTKSLSHEENVALNALLKNIKEDKENEKTVA